MSLIHDYRVAASRAVRALKSTYSIDVPLAAYRQKLISKSGSLSTNGIAGRYDFHGIGCRFDIDGTKVDLDFGPEGRCDGFDPWRLHLFATENTGVNRIFEDETNLKEAFEELESQKRIICPGWEPGRHLFYLASDVQAGV